MVNITIYCTECGDAIGRVATEEQAEAVRVSDIYCEECADKITDPTDEDEDDDGQEDEVNDIDESELL